jgi:CheY-like chemotaxis protein
MTDPSPFESVLAALSRAEVRYLVVGGVACALNGFVRTTEYVDILVDAEPNNIRRLLATLSGIGDGHARELRVEDFSDEEGAVRLVEDFPIDVFTRMGGKRYADMLAYRRIHDGRAPIPYVDAPGLILLKSGSPRMQDRIDVEALRRLRDSGGE